MLLSTFATLIVFSRYPSSASCVVTATKCSDSVAFPKIILGTCCSVRLVCASLTTRGSLSVVTLLLLSDDDELGVFGSVVCFERTNDVRSCVLTTALTSEPSHDTWTRLVPAHLVDNSSHKKKKTFSFSVVHTSMHAHRTARNGGRQPRNQTPLEVLRRVFSHPAQTAPTAVSTKSLGGVCLASQTMTACAKRLTLLRTSKNPYRVQ